MLLAIQGSAPKKTFLSYKTILRSQKNFITHNTILCSQNISTGKKYFNFFFPNDFFLLAIGIIFSLLAINFFFLYYAHLLNVDFFFLMISFPAHDDVFLRTFCFFLHTPFPFLHRTL